MSITREELLAGLDSQGLLKPTRKGTLDTNALQEHAIRALNTLAGLSRADKIKVINRMRKGLDI